MRVFAMAMALLAVAVMLVGITGTLRGRVGWARICDRRRGLTIAAGGFTVAVTAFGFSAPAGSGGDDVRLQPASATDSRLGLGGLSQDGNPVWPAGDAVASSPPPPPFAAAGHGSPPSVGSATVGATGQAAPTYPAWSLDDPTGPGGPVAGPAARAGRDETGGRFGAGFDGDDPDGRVGWSGPSYSGSTRSSWSADDYPNGDAYRNFIRHGDTARPADTARPGGLGYSEAGGYGGVDVPADGAAQGPGSRAGSSGQAAAGGSSAVGAGTVSGAAAGALERSRDQGWPGAGASPTFAARPGPVYDSRYGAGSRDGGSGWGASGAGTAARAPAVPAPPVPGVGQASARPGVVVGPMPQVRVDAAGAGGQGCSAGATALLAVFGAGPAGC